MTSEFHAISQNIIQMEYDAECKSAWHLMPKRHSYIAAMTWTDRILDCHLTIVFTSCKSLIILVSEMSESCTDFLL